MLTKKSTKKEIKELVSTMEEKYFRLVWFARRSEESLLILSEDGIKENGIALHNFREVQTLYPKETTNLMSQEHGDWEHGFNSGMLAGMRYVLTLMEEGKEQAEEEFPFLDT